jgi:cell division septation protein DedD
VIPANVAFPQDKSDFDLDGLSLPDTLPEGPIVPASELQPFPNHSAALDHIEMSQPAETSGMTKPSGPISAPARQPLRSRSAVMALSVVLGVVVLGAGGWFTAQRYLSTPSADVAPPPAPRNPLQPKAASARPPIASTTADAASKTASQAPTTAAAKPVEVVARKSAADAPAPKPVTPPAVAKANPPATPQAARPAAAKAAVQPPLIPHDGYAIQVVAVKDRGEADRIVARLVKSGYSGYAIRGQGAAADYYRVRIGSFRSREDAEEVADRLERAEGVKPWIIKETP